ncbi:hypothetical protein CEUSTIGMA_g3431.t1 [Chlamydomonas eustigma]|uniref:Plastid lipid-associated protein/fibrillin conserved domain-containing protein n=1 Tax=Chlamydomonas eustigma TaxID=1157962 RepID=A0A250WYS4_9CHLO|nr:hypothetical protein CEUSTIGMA_g3431.t1 [Chlamydomonas eustigma]|eukprot:GAX75988.1 hypothetical protein CEUSTIGMA_g3431.t1 [Chlamydomonas eustigma]
MTLSQFRISGKRPSIPGAGRIRERDVLTNRKQLETKSSKIIVSLVSFLTESLRVMQQDSRQRQDGAVGMESSGYRSSRATRMKLRKGNITGVLQRIRRDYIVNSYFVTGIIDSTIYEEDCFFADPTISFSGLELWTRNLQLLVPFLMQPRINLLDIRRISPREEENEVVLKADWTLETSLRLPWQPFISIGGSTEYTLNEDKNKVLRHVESWDVSGLQALLQILIPGDFRK